MPRISIASSSPASPASSSTSICAIKGVFFPIDPGADASLGGMAATRASGTNAVRYGTMKDNVLALKVVLANGEVMTTARRAKKTAAGYDLTRLIVGSEGTLGVITELTLRLAGIPEAIAAGVCPFPSVEAACNATIHDHPVRHSGGAHRTARRAAGARLQSSIRSSRCRKRRCCSSNFTAPRPASPSSRERFGEIAEELGGGPFDWATKAEDRTRLWQARHDAYWAQRGLRPGDQGARDRRLRADLAARRMRHRDPARHRRQQARRADRRPCRRRQFPRRAVGRSSTTPTKSRASRRFLDRLVERALAMDGTCTGEHGVGQGKMKYLAAEHGEPALDAMRAIKRALDPLDIMNPGKIVRL